MYLLEVYKFMNTAGMFCVKRVGCLLWSIWIEGKGGRVKGNRVELARN